MGLSLTDAAALVDEKLSTHQRNGLSKGQFALPNERALPIPDEHHARAALSRASQMLREGKLSRRRYISVLKRIHAAFPHVSITNVITGKKLGDGLMNLADAAALLDEAARSAHGWKSGDKVAYIYRFYNGKAGHGFAEGEVTSIDQGMTAHSTILHLEPAPGFRFGETNLTRHADEVHHIAHYSKRAQETVAERRKSGD